MPLLCLGSSATPLHEKKNPVWQLAYQKQHIRLIRGARCHEYPEWQRGNGTGTHDNIDGYRLLYIVMGAQYSTGTTSPEWKGWLEERCSLETVRSIYQNFRAGVSSTRDNDIDSDAFFITAEEFRRVNT